MAMSKLSYQEALDRGMCVTPRQLAQYLGVDQGKILRWIQNGELKGINVSETQRLRGGRDGEYLLTLLRSSSKLAARIPEVPSCARPIRMTW